MGRLRGAALRLARSLWLQPIWDGLDRILQRFRNYESVDIDTNGERALLRRLAPRLRGQTIVDAGANVGEWSTMARREIGSCTIVAIEPSRVAFDRLSQLPGIRPFRIALGERAGSATLHTAEPGASIASLHPLRHPIRPFQPANAEIVAVMTLDQLCADQGIERIAFLKIDVEGSELAVLKGAQGLLAQGKIDRLQFEFGAAHVDARTFLSDIIDRLPGFHLFRVMPGGLLPFTYRARDERFETANYLALRDGLECKVPETEGLAVLIPHPA